MLHSRVAAMMVLIALALQQIVLWPYRVEGGIVLQNRSNSTAVTVAVYGRGQDNMVLEIGLLDAGSIIDWDYRSIAANYSKAWVASPPVPAENLFVIKNSQSNSTVTSQYFYDGTSVTIMDDFIGGLSVKVVPGGGID